MCKFSVTVLYFRKESGYRERFSKAKASPGSLIDEDWKTLAWLFTQNYYIIEK